MKKIGMIMVIIALLLTSCGSNEANNNTQVADYVNNTEGENVVEAEYTIEETNDTADYEVGSQTIESNSWWRNDDYVVENQFFDANKSPLSTFSIDVDTASYSNIRRYLTDNQLPPNDIIRIEEMVNYFNYNHQVPRDGEPIGITTEIGVCPWNENNLLAMIGLRASDLDIEDLPNTNIVFLLDVSGSMDQPDKLPLLKKGFELLVEQLRPEDRVSIVVYAGASGVVLDGARGDENYVIIDAINRLEAGGSTAGSKGIERAYDLAEKYFIPHGNNRVILATDGDFNVGITEDDALIRFIEEKRDSGIHLSVLGFGTGNLKDQKLEGLADHGNGNYAYIDSILEAKKVLVDELYSTLYTLAKDTKIQVEFNPTKIEGYRLIGYENRLLENKDFDNDSKDAGEIGIGHTVTAFYELIPYETSNLKYQRRDDVMDEWFEVRVRYKRPNSDTSSLLVHPVEHEDFGYVSTDFDFAASVIEFGLLLKDSTYKGTANYEHIIETAKRSKGIDDDGYRAEFIHLVEIAKSLD